MIPHLGVPGVIPGGNPRYPGAYPEGTSDTRAPQPRGGCSCSQTGQADRGIQAYNFRLCVTDNASIRVPFKKPAGYDPACASFAYTFRVLDATDMSV